MMAVMPNGATTGSGDVQEYCDDVPEWTEGVCDDGAAILRDGEMVAISDLLAHLNGCERHFPQRIADSMARACAAAFKAGDMDKAKRMGDAQAAIAEVYPTVIL